MYRNLKFLHMPDFFPPRIRPVVPVTNIKSVGVYLSLSQGQKIKQEQRAMEGLRVKEKGIRDLGTFVCLFVD